jgi:hypothetical protein
MSTFYSLFISQTHAHGCGFIRTHKINSYFLLIQLFWVSYNEIYTTCFCDNLLKTYGALLRKLWLLWAKTPEQLCKQLHQTHYTPLPQHVTHSCSFVPLLYHSACDLHASFSPKEHFSILQDLILPEGFLPPVWRSYRTLWFSLEIRKRHYTPEKSS